VASFKGECGDVVTQVADEQPYLRCQPRNSKKGKIFCVEFVAKIPDLFLNSHQKPG
jgi:hypothetical protein